MDAQSEMFEAASKWLDSGAVFSACDAYRYRLWRKWSEGRRMMMGLLLNPSTADARKNDPTVNRMEIRARSMGFDGLYIGNAFAFKSTDPTVMLAYQGDPVGPENDQHILAMAEESELIVCGWGKDGVHQGRQEALLTLMKGFCLHAFRLNKNGTPAHPLYLGYDLQPVVWKAKESK
jgi:hypothetical protein